MASEPADHTATSLPNQELRSRAFFHCTPGLGLSTKPRFAEPATVGLRPIWAFTIGALVTARLAPALSAIVFSEDWARI